MIAIIGLHCRVPGATNAEELWDNLRRGVESITTFSDRELLAEGVDPSLIGDPDYVKARGVIDGIELFDAAFFGYTPREAELLDPQHRLFLECAWQCLESTGYLTDEPRRVGVFAGCGANTYLLNNLSADRELLRSTDHHQLLIGNDKDFLATRVSYKLDLRGPSVNVSTACSTSLVAVHQACQSILAGECDLAIAGGVSIPVPHRAGYRYQESGILSPDGHCRAFDAHARGTAVGSGVAIVVLKRWEDAQADGDRVYAVIRGSAINNDGSLKAGFTAPSARGQAEVIAEAMAVAGVEPKSIQYVETHGTGTQLGDPIEIAALTKAFRGASPNSIAIGSVKTNIGHCDAAAGAIGLIKTALSLHHQEIPPSLHFTAPNPEIDFASGPFYVNTRLAPWARNGAPRRAGVSSFGLGGTNAHVVLEEAPQHEPSGESLRPAQLLITSAKTADALRPVTEGDADAAFTLAHGRKHFAHRAAAVGESVVRGVADRVRRAAFLFPGGGAQYAGMGRDLYATEPVYREAIDACTRVLPIDFENDLQRPSNAMTALFATEYAMARLLMSWGIAPAGMIGHSLGEYTAACIAGLWTLEQTLSLVALRGRLLDALPPGAMLSVKCPARDFGAGLSIAAINSPETCVVSGPVEAIQRCERGLTERGIEVRRIHMDVAAHSSMVGAVLDEFRRFVETLHCAPPSIPWVSNLTGDWIRAEEAMDPGYWCRHFRETVRFADGVQRLFEDRDTVLLEVGPGQTLATLVHARRPAEQLVATSMRHPRETVNDSAFLLATVGRLWANGVTIDWRAFYANEQRRRVALPTHPFRRERYWIDPPGRTAACQPAVPPAASRPAENDTQIAERLRAIVTKLTGITNIPGGASFFELGLDSLTLVQVSREVKSEFGVKLALRQFLEDLTTIEKLAAFLPSPRERGEGARSADDGHKPLHFTPRIENTPRGLTQQQQQHLDQLITRYNARTRRSKDHAAQFRNVLADSRAAVGFKPSTKEMLYPIVGVRAEGSRLWDLDGNEYVDVTNAMGVTLFGHAPRFLLDALRDHADEALLLGPRTQYAGEAARLIAELTGMERVTFCNSGTEAVMAAIRLARTYTGRPRIVMFEGAYHGHSDQTLVQAGPEPIAPGIPFEAVANTIVLPWGDPESLEWIRANGESLAAVLVEPVQNLHLDVVPVDFLRELRDVTRELGVLLVFDEMITGFRVHPGGAQALFGIDADLATYGKIVGGGMPIGVVAGRAAVMDGIDGGVWSYGDASVPQAERTFFGGTFCQHPMAMIAAVAVLRELQARGPQLQEMLARRTAAFAERLNAWFREEDVPVRVVHFGSAFRFTFTGNLELLFFHLLERGVYMWEWRGCFLSAAHSDEDLDFIFRAVRESVEELRRGGYLPRRGIPLTPAQKQLWLLAQQDEQGALAYKTALSLKLRGRIDYQAMDAAVRALVARHEALRTVFPNGDAAVPSTAIAGLEVIDYDDSWFEQKNNAPMDLGCGPLFLAHLLRMDDETHILVLTAHHIITDGWSMTNLVHELMALYAGTFDAPPPMQFSQYAAWQSQFLAGDAAQEQLDWWLGELRELPPPPDLPFDRPRPAQRTYASRRATRVIDAAEAARIKAFCRERSCTLFMVLYAAYVALLSRTTDSDDLVVGISASGRGVEDSDALAGYCTHVLPVRNLADRSATFAGLLDATRARLLAAYDHQDIPFAVVLNHLREKRPVTLTFNLDKPVPMPAGPLAVELFTHPTHYSDFDVMLNVIDVNDHLVVDCDYATDLFDAPTIGTLLDCYVALLDNAITTPNERPSWSGLRQRQLPLSLHNHFETIAAQHPDNIALTFNGQHLNYRDLDERANALARRLGTFAPDTLIAVHLEPSFELIIAILAVLKAGGAYVPLDPASPRERVDTILEDARCAAIIDAHGIHPIGSMESTRCDASAARRDDPSNAAYVIYTSGSTGKPKGVVVQHDHVLRLFTATDPWFRFDGNDVWTLFHSSAFDFSVWEIFGALLHGGRLVIVPYDVTRDPRAFSRLLRGERVTVLNQTPSAFRHLMPVHEHDDALRLVIFGGEALDPATLAPWFERRGDRNPQLVNMYGITETTVHVTYRPLRSEDAKRGGSPIGIPIPDLTLHLLDDELQPVPPGVTGEICVGGAGVARGYLHRDALTRERFIVHRGQRLYRSGDLARVRADGELEYRGRRDAQVKVRGVRIELGEVEAALRTHPEVRDAAADLRGETLIAWYIGDRELDLRAHAARTLIDAMIPATFVRVDAFPLTRNGKLDRRALPLPAAETPYVPPRSDAEEILAAIWSDLLHVQRIGVHDNFFELGGDSIIGLQVATRAIEAGIRITPRDVHRHPTIAELAATVILSAAKDPLPSRRNAKTPIQLWFEAQRHEEPDRYDMPVLLEIARDTDRAALDRALRAVAAHHDLGDALRAEVTDDRLLLTAHHSLVDGVSWRILIDDLKLAYRGATLPPNPVSRFAWAAAIEDAARAGAFDDEIAYWHSLPPALPLRCDFDGEDAGFFASEESVTMAIEEERVPRRKVSETLLAALASVFGETNIDVETHGREELVPGLDASRTVGWLTAIHPAAPNPPRNGAAFLALEHYRRMDPLPRRDVLFNYLGRFDDAFRGGFILGLAPEAAPSGRGARNRRSHLMEINAFIARGALRVSFAFSTTRHRRESVERMANDFLAALACAHVPRPDTDLSDEQLKRALAALR